jgi:hypothetical protein
VRYDLLMLSTMDNATVAQTSAFEVCGSSLASRSQLSGPAGVFQIYLHLRRKNRGPQKRGSALRHAAVRPDFQQHLLGRV